MLKEQTMAGDPLSTLFSFAMNAASGGINANQNRGARPMMRTPGRISWRQEWAQRPDLQTKYKSAQEYEAAMAAQRRGQIAQYDANNNMTNTTGNAANNVDFSGSTWYIGANGQPVQAGGGGQTPPTPSPPGTLPPPPG
ncbi:MAG: hypothetical protein IH600_15130, partial [Bacteroidetes bacterium]|nr:hypothetical protein [Bacteroidota bacterium]